MPTSEPVIHLDARYSEADAQPTSWADAERALAQAEVSWISTVRPDGHLHVTPLLTVLDNATLYFCTGPHERKCRNLMHDPHVALTTGTNSLSSGLDLVVEGEAVRVTDEARLQHLADAWISKYGEDWRFDVGDGAFRHSEGQAWVFGVDATTAYAFGKSPYSHTRYRFGQPVTES